MHSDVCNIVDIIFFIWFNWWWCVVWLNFDSYKDDCHILIFTCRKAAILQIYCLTVLIWPKDYLSRIEFSLGMCVDYRVPRVDEAVYTRLKFGVNWTIMVIAFKTILNMTNMIIFVIWLNVGENLQVRN